MDQKVIISAISDDNNNILPVSAQQCSKRSAKDNNIKMIATINRWQRQHHHLAISAWAKRSERWQLWQKSMKTITINQWWQQQCSKRLAYTTFAIKNFISLHVISSVCFIDTVQSDTRPTGKPELEKRNMMSYSCHSPKFYNSGRLAGRSACAENTLVFPLPAIGGSNIYPTFYGKFSTNVIPPFGMQHRNLALQLTRVNKKSTVQVTHLSLRPTHDNGTK